MSPCGDGDYAAVMAHGGGLFGVFGPDDGDDVDAGGESISAVGAKEGADGGDQFFSFAVADGVFGGHVVLRGAGADFDEDEVIAVNGDEVNFTFAVGAVAGDDFHALLAEKSGGVGFTAVAKGSRQDADGLPGTLPKGSSLPSWCLAHHDSHKVYPTRLRWEGLASDPMVFSFCFNEEACNSFAASNTMVRNKS